MSLMTYQVIHFIGLGLVLLSVGSIFHLNRNHAGKGLNFFVNGWYLASVGLFLLLLGGFGAAAKLGSGLSHVFLALKTLAWLGLGLCGFLAHRKPSQAKRYWFLGAGLTVFAVLVAFYGKTL
jgi:hypothetical protein